ncbi:MAG: LysR family transcriptional regulator [Burkholderiaceae bacterium]|nr:LysR family transcriptional regulator [Burkholderiaceae bacterium]
MNLTLDALQILDAIDHHGSFAAAALALQRVPSAITYSVRKLEDDLDVLLFDRRGHRAKLTDAGQELLTQGRHILKAAQDLEQRVQRAATGWEVELRLVIDGAIAFDALLPVITEFERQACGTRLRISQEVLSGVWESLVLGRADLAIGAAFDGPDIVRTQGGFQTRILGQIDWVFAVAPSHPLASAPEPLSAATIQAHKIVAVGDTGRNFMSMTAGLLSGQETLTVPSLQAKLSAQLAGLGCGHLPRSIALPHLKSGALVEKATQETRLNADCRYVWRSADKGKALHWFIQRLSDPVVQKMLVGSN